MILKLRPAAFALFGVALAALVAFAIPSHQAQAWPARVVHVSDGDTVTVFNLNTGEKVRVRLFGIDAPEVNHGHSRPGQKYGERAKTKLDRLLRLGSVNVIPTGSHSYDRIVARVYVGENDVAHAMVQSGLAWDYSHYDRRGLYRADQSAARSANRGLWIQHDPTPPWQWRHQVWTH